MQYLNIAGFNILLDFDFNPFLEMKNFIPFIGKSQEKQATDLCTISVDPGKEIKDIPVFVYSTTTETGSYGIYQNDDLNIVIYQSAESGNKYRLLADKTWKELTIDFVPTTSAESPTVLNLFLMLAFIYSSSFHDTVLIHASSIKKEEEGFAFLGPSGIGKSTHSDLWLKYIPGSTLLNDDQPAVRIIGNIPYIYGTPWSGKRDYYRNERSQLQALYKMEQAKENRLKRLSAIDTFRLLLASASMIRHDKPTFNAISQTLARLAGTVPGYHLQSRPEREAAEISYNRDR